eukprot:2527369-Alexandrium_andersonii.AAC.1
MAEEPCPMTGAGIPSAVRNASASVARPGPEPNAPRARAASRRHGRVVRQRGGGDFVLCCADRRAAGRPSSG